MSDNARLTDADTAMLAELDAAEKLATPETAFSDWQWMRRPYYDMADYKFPPNVEDYWGGEGYRIFGSYYHGRVVPCDAPRWAEKATIAKHYLGSHGWLKKQRSESAEVCLKHMRRLLDIVREQGERIAELEAENVLLTASNNGLRLPQAGWQTGMTIEQLEAEVARLRETRN